MTEMAMATIEKKSSNWLRTITLFGGGVILLGLLFIFARSLQTATSDQLPGRQAAPFVLTTFEGQEVALADLQGQIVVLNFWASWCIECYDEAPLLEEAYQAYKDQGVMFVGVAYLDTLREALAYMDRYGITYPSGLDIGSVIYKDYLITGVPETFFIGRDGTIHHVQIGPIERKQLFQRLEALVAQGGS